MKLMTSAPHFGSSLYIVNYYQRQSVLEKQHDIIFKMCKFKCHKHIIKKKKSAYTSAF